ncbi:VOC family protein [Pelagibacterium limicola]|uniref:VOC family protein n=1 Tax=Pelagibacterium limicola TaxID=2791022 RepID=UPI0018AFB4BD|nr:VOC family protein [Pelagibacterium limicola]
MANEGHPPHGGFAGLVPELLVADFHESRAFWMDALGFTVAYERPEQLFAFLERPEGAQVMLCQRAGNWETAELEMPFGRGVIFQIFVASVEPIIERLKHLNIPLYTGPREVWRRYGDREGGKREIFVLDPNGYLVMLAHNLGERPLPE